MTVRQAEFIFHMGDRVRDVISGFEGIVVSRTEYLTGCNHYGIEASAKDDRMPYENIDEQRLELVEAGAAKLPREYGTAATSEPTLQRVSPGRPTPRSGQRRP